MVNIIKKWYIGYTKSKCLWTEQTSVTSIQYGYYNNEDRQHVCRIHEQPRQEFLCIKHIYFTLP